MARTFLQRCARLSMITCLSCLLAGLLTSQAAAQFTKAPPKRKPPPSQLPGESATPVPRYQPGDTGYDYGRANCGPVASPPVTNKASCVNCCVRAGPLGSGALTAAQVQTCKGYCQLVIWTNWP